jgi:hypothetical protein
MPTVAEFLAKITQKSPQKCPWQNNITLVAVKLHNLAKSSRKEAEKYFSIY